MKINLLSICSAFPADLNATRNLYLWHSLEALKNMGVNPTLFTVDGWKPFKKKIDKTQFPIKIYSCRYFSIPRYTFYRISCFFYLKRVIPILSDIIKKNKIDIIHAHGEIHGLAATILSQQLGVPVVVTIHGIDMGLQVVSPRLRAQFLKMMSQVDRLVFVGGALAKHFFPMLAHHDHCRIIYNGFQLPDPIPFEKKANNPIRIISVCYLYEGKGVDLTLKALGELKKQGIHDWVYTIIGSGDQKRLYEKIISEYALHPHIIWLGECDHFRVYEELNKSDIFCLPSYREAFGIAYVEAMAHGLLTIAVQGQGPEAFIKNNETGFLVEAHNVDMLMNVLSSVIINNEHMLEIAIRGQQHVLENFTWQQHAEKLFEIYKDLCFETG